jgi:hypothetical protein
MPNYYFSCACKECKEERTVYVTAPKQPVSEEYFVFTCNRCQSENIGTGNSYPQVNDIPEDAIVGTPAS